MTSPTSKLVPPTDEAAAETGLAQPGLEPLQVGADQRRDVRIGDRGAHPLVLADAGGHPVRDRHPQPRRDLAGQLGDPLLVRGVGHRPQQAHRERLGPGGGQVADGRRGPGLVQRLEHVAVGVDPAADTPDVRAADEQIGLAPAGRHAHFVGWQTVYLVCLGDGQGRLKALRGDQAHPRAGAGEQRVQPDGGAVGKDVAAGEELGERHPARLRGLREAREDAFLDPPRRGQGLAQADLAVVRDHDHIRERAAGVDADKLHARLLSCGPRSTSPPVMCCPR
jgi:hypothetical protein